MSARLRCNPRSSAGASGGWACAIDGLQRPPISRQTSPAFSRQRLRSAFDSCPKPFDEARSRSQRECFYLGRWEETMQATHPNVFKLGQSEFDAFLYSDIGEELNGSTLTILSMLARLGPDPWAEAVRWAELPQSGVVESLARKIGEMPLAPSALAEAHETATRLVKLLPPARPGARLNGLVKLEVSATPKWLSVALLYGALTVGMAVCGLLATKSSQAVNPTIGQPTATFGTGPVPPVHAAAAEREGTPSSNSLQNGIASGSCQTPQVRAAQAACGNSTDHKTPVPTSR